MKPNNLKQNMKSCFSLQNHYSTTSTISTHPFENYSIKNSKLLCTAYVEMSCLIKNNIIFCDSCYNNRATRATSISSADSTHSLNISPHTHKTERESTGQCVFYERLFMNEPGNQRSQQLCLPRLLSCLCIHT